MSHQIYPINTFVFTVKYLSSTFLPADLFRSLLLRTNYPACSNSFLPDFVYFAVLFLLLSHFRRRMQLLSGLNFLSDVWEIESYFCLKGFGVKFCFNCQIAVEYMKRKWQQFKPDLASIEKKNHKGYFSSLGSRQQEKILELFSLAFSHFSLGMMLQEHISISACSQMVVAVYFLRKSLLGLD